MRGEDRGKGDREKGGGRKEKGGGRKDGRKEKNNHTIFVF